MSINGFPVDGVDMTARELKAEGTVFSEGKIQAAMECGNTTRESIYAWCEQSVIEGHRRKARANRLARFGTGDRYGVAA